MLQLSQQQKLQLKLSPQQIQYIRLLQLPQLALEQAIKAELEVNPALEEGQTDDDPETQDDLQQDQAEPVTEPQQETSSEKQETDDSWLTEDQGPGKSGSDDEFSWEDFISTDDLYGYKTEDYYSNTTDDDDRPDYTPVQTSNFTDKIRDQIRLLNLTEKQVLISEHLLGSADPDGYLRVDAQKLADDFIFNYGMAATEGEIERVRRAIANLEPPGYLSRNLQECLLFQLNNMDLTETSENAIAILTDCFEEFSRKHFDQIMKILQLNQEELKDAFELIRHLNPKPGEDDYNPNSNYITPDFFVENDNGELIITLNDRGIPSLRINRKYVALAASKVSKIDDQTRQFIRKKVEDAKFFRQSIIQRRETMMKVMTSIVEIQRTFFETGAGLRPMILKDVADRIFMDISTVSRVVNSKYVQTEFGVFSLKHFFSEGIETDSGEEASTREVKEKIREILEAEDGRKPLSDDRIAEILNEKGFNIARRTVTKYREALNLPVARLRKKI